MKFSTFVISTFASVVVGAPALDKRQGCTVGFVFARGSVEPSPIVRILQLCTIWYSQANFHTGNDCWTRNAVSFEGLNTWPKDFPCWLCGISSNQYRRSTYRPSEY